jgi:hypothetical protein
MFEWISHNRDLFLVNYTEIGTCHQMAVELESEHCQFATSAEVGVVIICSTLSHRCGAFLKGHVTVEDKQ